MKRSLVALLVLFLATTLVAQAQGERQVIILRASGPLTPAMAEYLDRGIQIAEEQEAEALVFQLNTPGGQVDLMSRMIQSIRASEVPIVIFVAPRGAIAGSAGTVITLAGHAAAMAPETAIGAASPVGGQGEDLGETIEKKQKEILKSQARGLAERRGEEAIALAEAAIDEAAAASSAEALAAGMIDLIAEDLDDLLQKLDGLVVEVNGQNHSLQTVGAVQVEIEQSFIEQLLQTLTNPNIVFLLITVGVQAILIEIGSPGGWAAGFIGVICLALGAYGLGVLPVNWFGVIFILTAFVLFLLEIKAPTHGALTAAGVGSFIVGALVLFNSPGTPAFLRVSIPLVVGTSIATASLFLVVVLFALRAQRRRVEVGVEALLGRVGIAQTDLDPTGMIHVAGELWSAEMSDRAQELKAGTRAEVVAAEGLRLKVKAEEPQSG
jgi:membrane-bound serine protease (ClpP class)